MVNSLSSETIDIIVISFLFLVVVSALAITSYSYVHRSEIINPPTPPIPPEPPVNPLVISLIGQIKGKQANHDSTTIETNAIRSAPYTGIMTSNNLNQTTFPHGSITDAMLQSPFDYTFIPPNIGLIQYGPINMVYNVPQNPKPAYLKVLLVGAGGGGAASTNSAVLGSDGNGDNGGVTLFKNENVQTLVFIVGGTGGQGGTKFLQAIGGTGGTVQISEPSFITVLNQQNGQNGADGKHFICQFPVGGQTEIIQAMQFAGGTAGISPIGTTAGSMFFFCFLF